MLWCEIRPKPAVCKEVKDNEVERVNELWAHVWFDQISADILWCPSVTQLCVVQAHTDLNQTGKNKQMELDCKFNMVLLVVKQWRQA